MPGRNGGMLRRGGGNPKRNGGRPPNWLRQFCDDILASPKCMAEVKAILHDKSHPAFATMWKAVSERAHGKPEQQIDHGGEVVIRVKREPRTLVSDN
jgi:hypothetical protein